jgi:dihydroorotate dehydrogenase electron transfer subunit
MTSTDSQQRRIELLLATDAGYDPIVRAALSLSVEQTPATLVLFEAETFKFRPRPSTILVPHMPAGVIACVPALEEFGIASRLASTAGLPGCFDGAVTELAELWLGACEPETRREIHITVSGGGELLSAVEQLSRRFNLPMSVLPQSA